MKKKNYIILLIIVLIISISYCFAQKSANEDFSTLEKTISKLFEAFKNNDASLWYRCISSADKSEITFKTGDTIKAGLLDFKSRYEKRYKTKLSDNINELASYRTIAEFNYMINQNDTAPLLLFNQC